MPRQEAEQEEYNPEEELLDDEEEEEEEEDVVDTGRARRQRGCADDRQRAVFNQSSPEQVYAHYGIDLAAEITPEER